MSRTDDHADSAAAPTSPTTYTEADYQPWVELESGRLDRILRVLTVWYWNHVYRLKAFGVERLPKDGAYVLVPNHSSYTDPFLQAAPQRRHLRFMAKSTLFKHPLMRLFIKSGGGFPVNRGAGDVFAMELARRLLRAGRPVVIYPEGTRFRTSLELGPPKRGAARLALEERVPVVPAATWGVKERHLYGRRRWQRPRAVTIYGEPMDFSAVEATPANVDEVRDVIWARVHELYEEARILAAPKRRR